MPGREPARQALSRLEEVAEAIREAEVELRKSESYPAHEAHRHLSRAATTLADAERSLRAVLAILERSGTERAG